MRSTSAKASVTSAKYEPRRPERNASAPMTAPTAAPAKIPNAKAGQAFTREAPWREGGNIGAGAKNRRRTEGVRAAVPAEQVPALPDQRDEQREDEEVQHHVRGGDERHRGEQRQRDEDRQK